MLDLIFATIVLYYSFKTKPSPESFDSFVNKKYSSISSSPSSIIKRIASVSMKPSPKETWVYDIGVCCIGIVELKESTFASIGRFFTNNEPINSSRWRTIYVGFWNDWWEVYKQEPSSQQALSSLPSSSTRDAMEEKIQNLSHKAAKEKTKGSYEEAGKLYASCAGVHLRVGDEFSNYEAGKNFEEAYKCYKRANNWVQAKSCLWKAAQKFEESEKHTYRAACMFEKLGDYLATRPEEHIEAIKAYKKAKVLFDGESDTKWSIAEKLGDLLALLKEYHNANEQFQLLLEDSKSDSMYTFKSPEYLRKLLFCLLAEKKWDRYGQVLNEHQESMKGRQEFEIMKELFVCYSQGTLMAFEDTIKSSLLMPRLTAWENVILHQILSLSEGDLT